MSPIGIIGTDQRLVGRWNSTDDETFVLRKCSGKGGVLPSPVLNYMLDNHINICLYVCQFWGDIRSS